MERSEDQEGVESAVVIEAVDADLFEAVEAALVEGNGIYRYAPSSFRIDNRPIPASAKYPNREVSGRGSLRNALG